jgi:hypothetical protein
MITVRRFTKDDFITLNMWRRERDLADVSFEELPECGFMASHFDRPIACAFLRRCEGGFGIMDSVIADKYVDGSLKSQGLDLLFEFITNQARDFKMTNVLGFTVKNSMIKKSKSFGYKESDHKLMVLEIPGEM